MNTTAEPTDAAADKFPVSIKGVVSIEGSFVLLRNRRGEWELPGGKHEVRQILDCWLYDIQGKVEVLIVVGIPLPFVSDGGSPLTSMIMALGLVINNVNNVNMRRFTC